MRSVYISQINKQPSVVDINKSKPVDENVLKILSRQNPICFELDPTTQVCVHVVSHLLANIWRSFCNLVTKCYAEYVNIV